MTQGKAKGHPRVTFALFAYNQEKYIREAVYGAFSQTYEPLEIVLSDDCSTDRTFEIMQDMVASYRGQHSVVLRRNRTNIGLAAHVNAVLEQSQCEIVLVAAGDDVSLPARTSLSVEIFDRNPGATAVLLSADIMDENGRVVGERFIGGSKADERSQNIDDLLAWRHVTFGASRAIRREVFTRFGTLREDCPTEDTPLLLRSLICGYNILSPQKGVFYRRHENNLSGTKSLLRMNVGAIYDQYRDDLGKAEAAGFLSKKLAKMLARWITSDRKARDVRLKISSEGRLNISDYILALRHPSISFKDILKVMAKRFLLLKEGRP